MKRLQVGAISVDALTPISLLVSISVALVGGVSWFTSMYSKVEAHEVSLVKISEKQDVFQKEVIDRLARIETIIKTKPKQGE